MVLFFAVVRGFHGWPLTGPSLLVVCTKLAQPPGRSRFAALLQDPGCWCLHCSEASVRGTEATAVWDWAEHDHIAYNGVIASGRPHVEDSHPAAVAPTPEQQNHLEEQQRCIKQSIDVQFVYKTDG